MLNQLNKLNGGNIKMNRQVKVVKRYSYDTPRQEYYIIQEVVTNQGHTIEWPGIYQNEINAQKTIDSELRLNKR